MAWFERASFHDQETFTSEDAACRAFLRVLGLPTPSGGGADRGYDSSLRRLTAALATADRLAPWQRSELERLWHAAEGPIRLYSEGRGPRLQYEAELARLADDAEAVVVGHHGR